jgi:predicted helicase
MLKKGFLIDLHFTGDSCCLPLYHYVGGEIVENITDWVQEHFQKHYKDKAIGKLDIFHYIYAVIHNPSYRAKYEQNLKREFPRIPFYEGFWKWEDWGKQLMELHLNYEKVEAYPLERIESQTLKVERSTFPITRLMARKETGVIEVDTVTSLRGVPAEAWEYRLGTYSALEWVLERYKEKKPKDPTIAEKFNTYKFADYKESVIELLERVCAVSVRTMEIIKEMPE